MKRQVSIHREGVQVNQSEIELGSSRSATSRQLLEKDPATLPLPQRAKVAKFLSNQPGAVDGSEFAGAWNAAVLADLNGDADAEAIAPALNEAAHGSVTGIYSASTGRITLEVTKPDGAKHYGQYSWSEAKAGLVYHGVPTDDTTGLLIEAKQSPSEFLGELTIAGKHKGIQTGIGGNPEDPASAPKYLSPRGPALKAEPGEHSFYSENIKSLCGGNERLYHRLFYTVYRALQALESGSWTLFPIIVLVGAEGVGKSLFSALLARACGAYDPGCAGPYLMAGDGGGENKALVSSFLWDLNDISIPDRRGVSRFHSFLKSCHADEGLLLKGLHKDKIRVNPLRMFVIGINDDASSQSLIPPLDSQSGFKKKVIAFNASPMSHLIADRRESTKALCDQASAFRHYILNDWFENELPKHQDIVSSERTGVTHYVDPELAEDALSLSNEAGAFTKVCNELKVDTGYFWVGTWKSFSQLVSPDVVRTAQYLANMSRVLPHLVQRVRPSSKADSALWVIRHGPDSILDTELPWAPLLTVGQPFSRTCSIFTAASSGVYSSVHALPEFVQESFDEGGDQ